jgi:NADPH-dependent 2,4-dienoyl-CoA reductase/sulfur reductase-like enzyme
VKGWTRRHFGSLAGAACLTLHSPHAARSRSKPRVVVIGGGVAGATAAKYLVASGAPLDVTLVEPKRQYTTCFFSNLYLAGLRSLESLTHEYTALAQRYGINLIHDFATIIDPVAKTIALQSGAKLSYDCLIIAPGIAFKYGAIDGYDEAAAEILPHAWNAGPQTQLLRRQLESMEDGGVFLITAPPNPFRCPPGPYERASMVAYYFKQYKPRSKILILDAKDEFFEQDLFQEAWQRHYPGMIEWLPAQFTGGVKTIDVKDRAAITTAGSFKAAVINVIPPQMAGQLAQRAGLADQTGWCPIHPATFESKLYPDIYVLGDATDAGAMPKSAFVANSQAKLCAFTILAALTESRQPVPHLFNTCFTLLAADDAVSDAIAFKPTTETIEIKDIFISKMEESAATRLQTMQEANGWYTAFTHDVFG